MAFLGPKKWPKIPKMPFSMGKIIFVKKSEKNEKSKKSGLYFDKMKIEK